MKIVDGDCPPVKQTRFNDIRIGNIIMFPYHDSFADGVFLRIYHSDGHGKKNKDLTSMSFARLDDAPAGSTNDGDGTVCGNTYAFQRKMMDHDNDRKYWPEIVKAEVCLHKRSEK